MKKFLFVASILFATLPLTFTTQAQTGVTGTWRVEGVGPAQPWTLILKETGTKLTGAVNNCGAPRVEISEGSIDGDTIRFECRRPDGSITIALTGRINGDEIELKWNNMGPGIVDPVRSWLFGASAPPQFIAKRIPDADAPRPLLELATRVQTAPAVSFDRILHADREPQNWLTYSGTLRGIRHSPLTQVTPSNVKDLEKAWFWQVDSRQKFESTPLVVDGVMYTVRAPNDVVALDAATGRVIWIYPYTTPAFRVCCGRVNRGLAILDGTLFMGTLDSHLLAIDALAGKLLWEKTVADFADPACGRGICYSITHAPLVVKDKVIVGTAGAEGAIRGFIAAFDVVTGKEVWRFYTIPAPGEPGNDTWPDDSWKTGGASIWMTGSYDPELNLTYWGTGNPSDPDPDRLGDNLYSSSIVALDADTGKLKWHYQFTPHDTKDWDAAHVPVLAEIPWQGQTRKVVLQANKNGLMYMLDRITGQLLMGKAFVEVNWMDGFNEKGHPVLSSGKVSPDEMLPAIAGTNWYPPSYSLSTGLFYIPSLERTPGKAGSPGYGAMRAFDPQTGEKKWEFKGGEAAIFASGALTTASDLLFTGVLGDTELGAEAARLSDGYFYALDARTGQLLWKEALAGSVHSGPMSYSVNGKQYIAVAAGNTLFAFALRQ